MLQPLDNNYVLFIRNICFKFIDVKLKCSGEHLSAYLRLTHKLHSCFNDAAAYGLLYCGLVLDGKFFHESTLPNRSIQCYSFIRQSRSLLYLQTNTSRLKAGQYALQWLANVLKNFATGLKYTLVPVARCTPSRLNLNPLLYINLHRNSSGS